MSDIMLLLFPNTNVKLLILHPIEYGEERLCRLCFRRISMSIRNRNGDIESNVKQKQRRLYEAFFS